MTPDEARIYFCPQQPCRYFEPFGSSGQRPGLDHDFYLKLGLGKVIALKKQKLAEYEKELAESEIATEQEEKIRDKIENAKAAVKAGEAAGRWIKRHAAEARKMIPEMPDERAREILGQAAVNCDWIAENAPRTFWEAMQLYWFFFIITYNIEQVCNTVSFVPDRTFFPWYEKDVLKDKTLSRIEAGEIISCLSAKWHEEGGTIMRFGALGKASQGTRDASVYTIAGQDAHGKDACTDLTRLWMDVYDGYRLHYPDLKFRWHPGTDRDMFKRAIEVSRSGLGTPSIRNDVVSIQAMLDMYGEELTLEEARSWGVVGCNTPGPTIHSKGCTMRTAFYPNILKALEFTFFNGKDPEPGFEWVESIKTGDPTDFKDFEEFYQVWLKQWTWVVRTEVRLRNKCVRRMRETFRHPIGSLLTEGCLETGDDLVQYDYPWLSFQSIVGWVDTIDSLAGVKYWVYDKKKYAMAQLVEALKADWEGYEDMQADFRAAPKFGNDDDFVDDIMIKATDDVYEIAKTVLDARGKPVFLNALPLTWIWMLAPVIGALPNGRKRGDLLADSGLAPHPEFDKSGPWSRINSAVKVDQSKFKAYIYNQHWDTDSVAGEAGLKKLVDYRWSAMERGQSQLQYTMVGTEVFRDAQKHPDDYPWLTVRISGYNAFFVPLNEDIQEAVITRVDQEI